MLREAVRSINEEAASSSRRLRVMMITEGNYPFHYGGVSTWCHILINLLPDTDFVLYSIIDDPSLPLKFDLPENVVKFINQPLWGIRQRLEFQQQLTLKDIWRIRRKGTDRTVIEERFLPIFREVVEHIFRGGPPQRFAQALHRLHCLFLEYDYDTLMRSRSAMSCFTDVIHRCAPAALAERGYSDEKISLSDLCFALQWLYHWLLPIGSPVPEVDIAHAAMAGVCTLVAVMAKLDHDAAFLLTEHGVYLRERYFFEAEKKGGLFLKLFSLLFSLRLTELTYAMADKIAPCCNFNRRWELRHGVDPAKLQTIYYGVDSTNFFPNGRPYESNGLVVIWMGRIDPLKDLFTLLNAAAVVHQERPEIRFRLFGSASPDNQRYFEKCLELRKELGLEDVVEFAGYRSDTVNAYNEGDIFVLSSKSEAFPYVNLEAMLCQRPVVSTAVGGVPEQLEGCGFAVEPCNPQAMANAILQLAADPELRRQFGLESRRKVMEQFSIERFIDQYAQNYHHLSGIPARAECSSVSPEKPVLPVTAVEQMETPDSLTEMMPAEVARKGSSGSRKPKQGVNAELIRFPGSVSIGLIEQLGVSELAREISERDAKPIDSYEVTALLEAQGITDAVARNRYGFPSTFELGEAVFYYMHLKGIIPKPGRESRPHDESFLEKWMDYSRGLAALLPVFVLLMMVALLSLEGVWDYPMILAFSIGMTSSMVVSSGLLQSISRRLSIYVGMKHFQAARTYMIRAAFGSVFLNLMAALLAALIAVSLSLLTRQELIVFIAAFIGLGTLWLLGGQLAIAGKASWLGWSMAAGLLVGVATSSLTLVNGSSGISFSRSDNVLGGVAGFLTAFILLAGAVSRLFTEPSKIKPLKYAVRMPPLIFLIDEAAPYFLYGSLYMVFILIPHLFALTGKLPPGIDRMQASRQIEVVLTAAMLPMAVLMGITQRSMRLFWRVVPKEMAKADMNASGEFQGELFGFMAHHRKRLVLWLVMLSVFTGVGFILVAKSPEAAAWAGITDLFEALTLLLAGLLAFGTVGIAIYNALYCITLGNPYAAVAPVTIGLFAMLGVGVTAFVLDYRYALIAFFTGAFVFLVLSRIRLQKVVLECTYHITCSI